MRLALAFFIAFALLFPCQAAQVTATWSYDFSNATICGATVSQNCLDHFEVGLLSAAGAFQTLNSIGIPATAPSGIVTGISASFNVNGPFGPQTLACIMVAKDASGARVTSAPAAATVAITIAPSNPGNFAAVVK